MEIGYFSFETFLVVGGLDDSKGNTETVCTFFGWWDWVIKILKICIKTFGLFVGGLKTSWLESRSCVDFWIRFGGFHRMWCVCEGVGLDEGFFLLEPVSTVGVSRCEWLSHEGVEMVEERQMEQSLNEG